MTASLSDYESFVSEDLKEIAVFRKTGCFGTCPIYRVHFYEGGRAVYRGQMNVEMEGKHFGLFNQRKLRQIIRKADRNRFFLWPDVFPVEEKEFLPDLSNTITTIHKGDMKKSITHNHSAPEELKDIENAFLELIDSIEWMSVNDK
ncbi:MAG: hypothetical protein EA362_11120 [Saprospirales bacterium]|nr:MAG: hypothetical protein EA362_11120 [Saprospirales bacterium]